MVTISLSRLIKSYSTKVNDTEVKQIHLKEIEKPLVSSELDERALAIEKEKKAILKNYEQEAQTIVQKAMHERDQVLHALESEKEAWEQERLQWIEAAKKEGLELGLAEGRQQGYEEYAAAIAEARAVVEQSKTAAIEHVEKSEATILELAMKIAEKVLDTALKEDPAYFVPLVKMALKEARDYKEIQIQIHPSQYEMIVAQSDELEALFPTDAKFYIYPNEDLEVQQCFIESTNGRIDASVDSQLQEIKEKLFEILEGDGS